MAIEKIKILGAVLELPAKQHCQFSPFGPFFEINGLDWHCCPAGRSKTAPRILTFSMAMGADCTFELISIKTCAPQFKWLNKSFLGSVRAQRCVLKKPFLVWNDCHLCVYSSLLRKFSVIFGNLAKIRVKSKHFFTKNETFGTEKLLLPVQVGKWIIPALHQSEATK